MNFAEEFPFLKETLTGVPRKDWLYDKPEQWTAYELFKNGQNFVANIKVVNDAAEKTVKLYSDYAAILTEHEEPVCCRLSENIKNKLVTLKNQLWLLIYNLQPQHL